MYRNLTSRSSKSFTNVSSKGWTVQQAFDLSNTRVTGLKCYSSMEDTVLLYKTVPSGQWGWRWRPTAADEDSRDFRAINLEHVLKWFVVPLGGLQPRHRICWWINLYTFEHVRLVYNREFRQTLWKSCETNSTFAMKTITTATMV